jgi:nicotinate-nucleotide--dimethylbenzimidazole phosphoribosyltransferase
VLRAELALPPGLEPVAFLCVGYPVEFRERPLLEETGWHGRRALEQAIHSERYCVERETAAAPSPEANDASPSSALPEIAPFDEAARAAALAHQLRLAKPIGSLGRLEELAAWVAGARGRFPVDAPTHAELCVFVGDHGVVREGVSAYSSAITAAMVVNFVSGGAAINALADSAGVALTVVDVGVAGDLSPLASLAVPPSAERARFVAAKVRAGTGNLLREPAMSEGEAEAALAVGARLAIAAAERGADLLIAGEMGIANSTAAAALLAALAGVAPEEAVGRGAGIDDAGLKRKAEVVADALRRHGANREPLAVLASLGGLEIAALAGFMIGGASRRLPILVDGFISGSAALVACALRPRLREYVCLSHRSAERGHAKLCEALGKVPLLDLGLRLGEGTGGALAVSLVRAAVRAQREMATLSTAGILGRTDSQGGE